MRPIVVFMALAGVVLMVPSYVSSHSAYSYHAQVLIKVPEGKSFNISGLLMEFSNAFDFEYHEGGVRRDGRVTEEWILKRDDGALVDISNFMNESVYKVGFHSRKKSDVDWEVFYKGFMCLLKDKSEGLEMEVEIHDR